MSQTYGGNPSESGYGSGAGRSGLPEEFESKVHIGHQKEAVNVSETGGLEQTPRAEEEGETRPFVGKGETTGEKIVVIESEEVAYEVIDPPTSRAQAAAAADVAAPVVVEGYTAEAIVVPVPVAATGTVLEPGPTVVGGTVVPEKALKISSSTSSSSSSEAEEEAAVGVAAPGETTPLGEKPKKKKNIFRRIEEKVKGTLTGHHHGSETSQK